MSASIVEREMDVAGAPVINANATITNVGDAVNPQDAVNLRTLGAKFPWISASGQTQVDSVTITINTLTLGAVQTMLASVVGDINAITSALQTVGIVKV